MDHPSGWLLRMKQYPRRTYEQFDAFEKQFAHMGEGITHYTTFGNFDRVEFVPIYSFGDYHRKNASDDNWFGKQQPILLYALKECGQQRVFQMTTEDGHVQLGTCGKTLKCRFVAHTMIYVSGTAKMECGDYSNFLKLIVKKIHDMIDCYHGRKACKDEFLEYEVFGTFNSSELSIVWAVDQYVDVLYLVDQLRYLRFICRDGSEQKICVSTYTVISANKGYWDKLYTEIKGTAVVQLECSTVYDTDRPNEFDLNSTMTFIKNVFIAAGAHFGEAPGKIGESALLSCAGEYDFIVDVPFCVLIPIFRNESEDATGLTFSMHNKKFAQYIRQTTTRLGYLESDIDEECKKTFWNEYLKIHLAKDSLGCRFDTNHLEVIDQIATQSQKQGGVYSLYKQLYIQMEQLIPYSGLHKTLELLYRDYVEIQCTAIDHLWVKDYHEQFIAVLKIIESYLESLKEAIEHNFTETEPARYLESLNELFGILQQQVNHISESSKLFFEAPNSKIGYTPQFDLIMHAYYGIVKEIIQQAYHTPKDSWQYLLVPVINFANTNKIESAMQRTLDDDRKNSRLISIQVPYGSWSNPLYYVPFFFHEIYHYISPADRKARNISMLVIIFHQMCMTWLTKAQSLYFAKGIQKDSPEQIPSEITFVAKLDIAEGAVQGKITDLSSKTEKKSLSPDMLWEIRKEFTYPLYLAITEDREELYNLITCSTSDCTAYELRDALENWLSAENNNEKIKWIQGKIRRATEIMQQKKEKFQAEPYTQERAEYWIDESNQTLNTYYQEFIDNGLSLDWTKWKDLKDEGVDKPMALSTLCELREIYPDVAMVLGTSMGLCEYLLQFALLQSNLLNTPGVAGGWELPLRLGSIIDYLLRPGERLSSLETKFVQLFTAYLALSEGKSGQKNVSKQNRQIARQWFNFFINIYKRYKEEYDIYRAELRTQIEKQYVFDENFASQTKEIYAEYWTLLGGYEQDKTASEHLFDLTIRLIQCYQGQNSLIKLKKIWENKPGGAIPGGNASTSSVAAIRFVPTATKYITYYLNSSDALFEQLRKMFRQLDENHQHIFGEPCGTSGIWYRGIADSSYHILPSMFVNYSLGKEWDGTNSLKTPAEILEHRFQQFKFRSDGAPELVPQSWYQSSDYLALMQHYQVPTNMLDWSEDIFGSLYFALEGYIKQAPNEKPDDAVDAAVYLLDPAAYNRARADVIKAIIPMEDKKRCHNPICADIHGDYECQQSQCQKHRECYVRRTAIETRDEVPNISVDLNRDIYAPLFCSQKRVYADGRRHYINSQLTKFAPIDNSPMCFDLPVAVYTSRLNPRIRAQSGQFVVYDPYTPPVFLCADVKKPTDLNGCYDYIALDKIQEKWLQADESRRPFMLKLVVNSWVKHTLAQQLRHMGIYTIKYYPELGNAHFSFD